MKHISFAVPGIPVPGGSKKAFFNKKTGRAMVVDAAGQRNKNWRSVVGFYAREKYKGDPLLGPLKLSVTFLMPRPKAHRNKMGEVKANAPFFCTTRPDTTKLVRALEDALTGILWGDDSQIVIQTAVKVYSDHSPGATVDLWEMDANAATPEAWELVRRLA